MITMKLSSAKDFRFTVFMFVFYLALIHHEQTFSQQRIGNDRAVFVIVHGAWGGSWAFRAVDSLLTAKGHLVYRPSLTGQGERVHLATPEVGLTTHINDVVNMILYE